MVMSNVQSCNYNVTNQLLQFNDLGNIFKSVRSMCLCYTYLE